jgi:hypothetical protein
MSLKFFTSNYFLLENNFWYNLFNIICTLIMCWSWGIELGYHQNERISWRSLILLRITCLGEHNIRRDCIGGYSKFSASGLLLTSLFTFLSLSSFYSSISAFTRVLWTYFGIAAVESYEILALDSSQC